MLPIIPEDAIEFIRAAFAQANQRATNTLARQPSMHEEGLDFQLIAALDEVGSRVLPGSGAAVEIETHWLGGRRHFDFLDHRRWEIADIGLLVAVRRLGVLLARKVALLQSKRLYSSEIPVHELELADFRIGIGRLFDRTEAIPTLTTSRAFEFSEESVYGAMTVGSDQIARISTYEASRAIPVYYNLYNPPTMPYRGLVPARALQTSGAAPELGCRVMTAGDVHGALAKLPSGRTPSFSEVVAPRSVSPSDSLGFHGWRIESFVADELLRCRQGRLFEDAQDTILSGLLYGRTAPIAAGILVTIDLSGGD
jgi:hypothetical protein